jgi:hypothetical protein
MRGPREYNPPATYGDGHGPDRDQSGDHARQAGNPRHAHPVELVLRKLAEGATEAELLDAYPILTKVGIDAARVWEIDGFTR